METIYDVHNEYNEQPISRALIQLKIHCSYGSVCLLVFAPCLLVSFNPLILFCFARKRQGDNSKTARFIYPPGSILNMFIF